ncbi:hypothetical protein DIPPA_12057 [Diplonema papillatum]|nr:hypothetical protein DIPPA_34899 [Diplonema papillatum]KAJ9437213.1 hypothetical protein DIPPA_05582 [Diplonema papillatum]KAJ9470936.1 hypothetical protein DIPPA_12057 [Diplonema papillatum]
MDSSDEDTSSSSGSTQSPVILDTAAAPAVSPQPTTTAAPASDDESEDENYILKDAVTDSFLSMKLLLHTKLTMPKDVTLPPYRLLGRFNPNSPELWGHSLAALAEEWCLAYLNHSGGMLFIGVDSAGIIEGLPLNTHHSQLHAFLSPFFCSLDQFWPPVSHGLISLSLLPVYTKVAEFEPYNIIMIRVRKGPMPCYVNSRGDAYEGDHVLKKLTQKEINARIAAPSIDTALISRYMKRYLPPKNRNNLGFGDVLKGSKPHVFYYSTHWSHPPLTLIPESATTGSAGKTVEVLQSRSGKNQPTQSISDAELTSMNSAAPCKHQKWRLVSDDTSGGRCRLSLACVVCNCNWKLTTRGTLDDIPRVVPIVPTLPPAMLPPPAQNSDLPSSPPPMPPGPPPLPKSPPPPQQSPPPSQVPQMPPPQQSPAHPKTPDNASPEGEDTATTTPSAPSAAGDGTGKKRKRTVSKATLRHVVRAALKKEFAKAAK